MKPQNRLPAAALGVATLALAASIGVPSYAAKLITGQDVKNSSLTGKDIKKDSITGADLEAGSVTGSDVKNGSLGASDLIAGTLDDTVVARRLTATAAGTVDAARAAAPEVVLYRKGPLTIYTKCFTDSSGPETYSENYIKTSVNGAIFDSDYDSGTGGPAFDDFLNISTPEEDRNLWVADATLNTADFEGGSYTDFAAYAPGNVMISGTTTAAAKNGNLAGGNGAYGAGNVCIASAQVWSN